MSNVPTNTYMQWPSFFGVLCDHSNYLMLLYFLISLPLGIFGFTWLTTGMSLALGFLAIIIGFPLLVFWLISCRGLVQFETHLLGSILQEELPSHPVIPSGEGIFERIGTLLKDKFTWISLLYLFLRLPLGIIHFTTVVASFSLSVALMLAPLVRWEDGPVELLGEIYHLGQMPPTWLLLGLCAIGFLAFVGSMHLIHGLGRAQMWFSRKLLYPR